MIIPFLLLLMELLELNIDLKLFANPVEDISTLSIDLEDAQFVEINMTNPSGKKMAFAFSGNLTAGTHEFAINAAELSVGEYFVTLVIEGKTKTVKLAVAR